MPEVENLQEQIGALQQRIDLVIQNKEKVRPKIFEKVKADYEKKLESLFNELNPYKEKIEIQIDSLQDSIAKLTDEIDSLEEEQEEFELRFIAGEFGEDDYKPRQEEFNSIIENKKAAIEERREARARYQTQLAFITGEPGREEVEPEAVPEEPPEEMEEPLESQEADNRDFQEYGDMQVDQGIEQNVEEEYERVKLEDTSGGLSETDQEPLEQRSEQAGGDEYIWTSKPVLDVIEGDFAGESYPMDKDRITVGRGPNNDIQLATDTSVSRHHSQLTRENDCYVLVDLESSNGTSVNGTRINRTYLKPNDEIMIGQSKLIIRPSKD